MQERVQWPFNLPGHALVNPLAAFPDLDELEEDFDILYFLDLCSGIEAAVLQESLACVGAIGSFTARQINPIVLSILDANVLVRYEPTGDTAAMARELLAHRNAQDIMALLRQRVPSSGPHLSLVATGLEFAGDLGLEGDTGLPLVLTAHSLPMYLSLPQTQQERRALHRLRGELAARYADFKAILYSLRDQAYGDESLRIPPIALEVFEITHSRDDFGTAVLEVRHKYASVRRQFTELDEIMRSRSQSPIAILREQAKLRKSISKLFSAKEVDGLSVLTSFATELNDGIDLSELADGASGIDWNKIVSSVLHHAEDMYWKFRLRPMHESKRRYLELSTSRVASIVRHHFGHQLTSEDLVAANHHSALVAALAAISNPEPQRGDPPLNRS
jgi:hypothetical protein